MIFESHVNVNNCVSDEVSCIRDDECRTNLRTFGLTSKRVLHETRSTRQAHPYTISCKKERVYMC